MLESTSIHASASCLRTVSSHLTFLPSCLTTRSHKPENKPSFLQPICFRVFGHSNKKLIRKVSMKGPGYFVITKRGCSLYNYFRVYIFKCKMFLCVVSRYNYRMTTEVLLRGTKMSKHPLFSWHFNYKNIQPLR